LAYDWRVWARPNQLPPATDWLVWLLMAGRGFGKTRVGAEWCRAQVETDKNARLALIAKTSADARDVMVEGESGLLAICPPWNKPLYEPSKRRLTWPNGAMATLYSAEEPDTLRGPQHSALWCDELASWKYPEAWDMAQFGLRLGNDPRSVVTTTPRPIKLIKELVGRKDVHVTRGSTWDNAANLPATYIAQIRERYQDTRLGRQEIDAELLTDTPGALWTYQQIEDGRRPKPDHLQRIVIAIDPAVTSGEDADETGIIVAGTDAVGDFYVLEDATMRGRPDEWASRAIALYRNYAADRIVGETNNGGEMIESTLRAIDRNIAFTSVRATRGKLTRAEPVSAVYERGRAHHCGVFPKLEDQMCSYTVDSKESPDRLDAMVWAAYELVVRDIELQIF
jgi:phage terminase large subunit-like protein